VPAVRVGSRVVGRSTRWGAVERPTFEESGRRTPTAHAADARPRPRCHRRCDPPPHHLHPTRTGSRHSRAPVSDARDAATVVGAREGSSLRVRRGRAMPSTRVTRTPQHHRPTPCPRVGPPDAREAFASPAGCTGKHHRGRADHDGPEHTPQSRRQPARLPAGDTPRSVHGERRKEEVARASSCLGGGVHTPARAGATDVPGAQPLPTLAALGDTAAARDLARCLHAPATKVTSAPLQGQWEGRQGTSLGLRAGALFFLAGHVSAGCSATTRERSRRTPVPSAFDLKLRSRQ